MDQWLTRYRKKGYDCSDFAAEVLNVPTEAIAGALAARKGWRPTRVPVERSLVLLRRNSAPPHVGIYLQKGVLHLGERSAMWQPMHVIKRDYNNLRFYALRNNHK